MAKCAKCKCKIHQGEDECDSRLYMSSHILCLKCSKEEDEAIDAAGTNEIMRLLASYGPSNFYED